MTERGGAIIFYTILAPPNAPPPQTPQYLTNLMTERGRHYICLILAPAMPPSLDATILNYPIDREMGAPLSFVGIWRPPMPPPPDATILNYLTDREGGGHYLL